MLDTQDYTETVFLTFDVGYYFFSFVVFFHISSRVFNAAPLVDCMPRRYRLHVGFLPVTRRFFVHTLLNNSHIFHSFGEFVERAEVSVNGERNKLVRRQIGILIRNSISHK